MPADFRFAILVARFNSGITEKLLAGAIEALTEAPAKSNQVFYVPGAFELPLAAQRLAKAFDGIVALGAVIRGETPAFRLRRRSGGARLAARDAGHRKARRVRCAHHQYSGGSGGSRRGSARQQGLRRGR